MGSTRGGPPRLRQRDHFAALQIVRYCADRPQAVVFALMGDLHLAQGHLPAALKAELERRGSEKRLLVAHQNPEALYWKLAKRGVLPKAGVVKLRRGVFCLMNTPPWTKLQSYLGWMDRTVAFDDFLELVQILHGFLGVKAPVPETFDIVWPGRRSIGQHGSFSERRLRQGLWEALGSWYVPQSQQVILATRSLNAAATQAAVYLHARLSARQWEYDSPRTHFYGAVWVEALGYFGSKLLNPHRRCPSPDVFERAAKSNELARLVFRHWKRDSGTRGTHSSPAIRFPRRHTTKDAVLYYRLARCLGQMLGESLYQGVASNQIALAEIRALFHEPFDNDPRARQIYLEWMRREFSDPSTGRSDRTRVRQLGKR